MALPRWGRGSVFLIAQDIAGGAVDAEFVGQAVSLAPFAFPVAFVIGFDLVDLGVARLLGFFDGLLDGDPARTRFVREGERGGGQRGSSENGGSQCLDHL